MVKKYRAIAALVILILGGVIGGACATAEIPQDADSVTRLVVATAVEQYKTAMDALARRNADGKLTADQWDQAVAAANQFRTAATALLDEPSRADRAARMDAMTRSMVILSDLAGKGGVL